MEQLTANMAESVLRALAWAMLGGCFLALAVFLACRVFPRMPASARYWLWWLVSAKFVFGLVLALLPFRVAVSVPVALPASVRHSPALHQSDFLRRFVPSSPVSQAFPASQKASKPSIAKNGLTASPQTQRREPLATNSTAASGQSANLLSLGAIYQMLAGIWAMGVLCGLFQAAYGAFALWRMVQNACPVDLPEVHVLQARLFWHRVPRVALSSCVNGPLVTGGFGSVVLFPPAYLARLSSDERTCALAHEWAHVQRGDLLTGLVPAFARLLFWWCPPIHWAYREGLLAREEACDNWALRVSGQSAQKYGALLLRTVAPLSPPVAGAGMASMSRAQLRRRLVRLGQIGGRREQGAGFACVGVLSLGMAPWKPMLPAVLTPPSLVPPSPLPTYTLTDLGTLGGHHGDALAISDAGIVTGAANIAPRSTRGHAYAWQNETMRDLASDLPYVRSVGTGVSQSGQITGWAYNKRNRPVAWVFDGKTRRLDLPRFRYGRALAISDTGIVVGVSQSPWKIGDVLPQRAWVAYRGETKAHDLGTLGGLFAVAQAVNDDGVVVGKSDIARKPSDSTLGPTHAFVWQAGRMRDLGTLSGGRNSAATAVSNRGEIVGFGETGDGTTQAFVHNGETLQPLTHPPQAWGSIAYGINDRGTIVGSATWDGIGGNRRRAVMWQREGAVTRPIDLNAQLDSRFLAHDWELETARAINEHGQIVGQGWHRGKRRAFLLTPQ